MKGGDGRVVFSRLGEDGTQTELFFDRPYSNAIHCLGPNDFLYGARWELKRYRDGQIAVVADQFVHIAAIREGRGDSVVVTDSDSESVVIVNPETGRKEVIATSKGQMLGDPLVKLQRVGSNVYGMTPDGTLIRYNLERDATTVLLSITGQGEWDQLLRGHELKAPRAFVLDPGTLALYVAVNHGIFRLSTRTRKLELYAGSENHYGYADGPREQARFAVIRDLELHGRTLYVADAWNDRVRAIDLASGEVSTVAGSGRNEYKNRNDGCSPALEYNLNRPLAIEVFDGRLIVANSYSHYLVSVAEGDACPFAGAPRPSNNQYGGDHVDGNKASFNGPRELSATTKGLLVADMWNNAIRAVDENGTVSTVYQHDKLARFPSDVVSYRGNIIYSSSDATLKSVRGQ